MKTGDLGLLHKHPMGKKKKKVNSLGGVSNTVGSSRQKGPRPRNEVNQFKCEPDRGL